MTVSGEFKLCIWTLPGQQIKNPLLGPSVQVYSAGHLCSLQSTTASNGFPVLQAEEMRNSCFYLWLLHYTNNYELVYMFRSLLSAYINSQQHYSINWICHSLLNINLCVDSHLNNVVQLKTIVELVQKRRGGSPL